MKLPFKPGDQKTYIRTVTEADLAQFESGLVHPVYSTFALARDAEWACRLFVLEMLEPGEEGVGSRVSVEHNAPAVLGSEVRIVARLVAVEGNRVECSWEAFCGERRIAWGEQTQHILDKARFLRTLEKLG